MNQNSCSWMLYQKSARIIYDMITNNLALYDDEDE